MLRRCLNGKKHSQSSTEEPHYQDLLEFIDLWAPASETSTVEQAKGSNWIGSSLPKKSTIPNRPQLTSFITSTSGQTGNNCTAYNDGSEHPCMHVAILRHSPMRINWLYWKIASCVSIALGLVTLSRCVNLINIVKPVEGPTIHYCMWSLLKVYLTEVIRVTPVEPFNPMQQLNWVTVRC